MAIARSLVTRPKMLLADEPTGALDSATSFDILKVLQRVQGEGVTVVIITHEHDISAMTDRVVHLVDGRVDWDRPQQRHDPAARAAIAAESVAPGTATAATAASAASAASV